MNYRELLKDKKRIVVKVGSSSLIHKETNKLDLRKLEVLVRELSEVTPIIVGIKNRIRFAMYFCILAPFFERSAIVSLRTNDS